MTALQNSKHELFAQGVAQGKSSDEAYALAGYSPHRSNASRLSAKDSVRARIQELQAEGAARAGVTVDWVIAEIKLVAQANMADYLKLDDHGDPHLDFAGLTREQAAALAEVTVESFRDGRTTAREVRRLKFKLASKLDALEKLCKYLNMYKETQDLNARVEHVYSWLPPSG